MNVRGGEFLPGPGYVTVQPVFPGFGRADGADAALGQFHQARAALALTIKDERGEGVPGWVHITDFSEEIPDAELEVESYPPITRS